MKSEKAEAYINSHAKRAEDCCCEVSTYIGKIVVPVVQVIRAVEIAEQEAEERTCEELTRWNDLKRYPRDYHTVLLKIKNDDEDSVKYAVGYNEYGRWRGGGIGHYDHVVGWREIHENEK